jgi:hypothetical protein
MASEWSGSMACCVCVLDAARTPQRGSSGRVLLHARALAVRFEPTQGRARRMERSRAFWIHGCHLGADRRLHLASLRAAGGGIGPHLHAEATSARVSVSRSVCCPVLPCGSSSPARASEVGDGRAERKWSSESARRDVRPICLIAIDVWFGASSGTRRNWPVWRGECVGCPCAARTMPTLARDFMPRELPHPPSALPFRSPNPCAHVGMHPLTGMGGGPRRSSAQEGEHGPGQGVPVSAWR